MTDRRAGPHAWPARLLPLLPALLLLPACARASAPVDSYLMDDGLSVEGRFYATANTTFVIKRSGWLAANASYAFKVRGQGTGDLLLNGGQQAIPAASARFDAQGSKNLTWVWGNVSTVTPVMAGDALMLHPRGNLNVSVVEASCDPNRQYCTSVAATSVRVRVNSTAYSNDDGKGYTRVAAEYYSALFQLTTGGFVTSFTAWLAPHPQGVLVSLVNPQSGATLASRWVYSTVPSDGAVDSTLAAVQQYTVTLPRDSWVNATAGHWLQVYHTSLSTSRTYTVSINADTGAAISGLEVHEPEAWESYGNDDAAATVALPGTLFSASLVVRGGAGFLSHVDIRASAAPSVQCVLTVNVTHKFSPQPAVASGSFRADGFDSSEWHGVTVSPPVAVYPTDVITVVHSCGGDHSYVAAATLPDLQAVARVWVATAPTEW